MSIFSRSKTQVLEDKSKEEGKKSFKDTYMNEVDPSLIKDAEVTPVAEVAPAIEAKPASPVVEPVVQGSTPVVPVEPANSDTEIKPVFDTPEQESTDNKIIDKFTNIVDPNEVSVESNPPIIDKYMSEVDPALVEEQPEAPKRKFPKRLDGKKKEEVVEKEDSKLDDTLIKLEPVGEEEPVNEHAIIQGNVFNEVFGLNEEDFENKRIEYENSPKADEDFERIFGMPKEKAEMLLEEFNKTHNSSDDKFDSKDEQFFEDIENQAGVEEDEKQEENPFETFDNLDAKDKAFFKKFDTMGNEIQKELEDSPMLEAETEIKLPKENNEKVEKIKEETKDILPAEDAEETVSKIKEEKQEEKKAIKVEFSKEDALKSLDKIKKELKDNEDFLVTKEQALEEIDRIDSEIKEVNKRMKSLDNYILFTEEEQREVDLIKEQRESLEKEKKGSEASIKTYEGMKKIQEEDLSRYESIIDSSETIIPELVGFEYLDSKRKKEIIEMLDVPAKDKERYLSELENLSFKNVDGMDITKDLIIKAKTRRKEALVEVEPLRVSVDSKNSLIREEQLNIERIENELRENDLEYEELVNRTNSEEILELRRSEDEQLVDSYKEEKKIYEKIAKLDNYSPLESLEKIIKDYDNDLIDEEELSLNLDTLKTHIKTVTDNDEKERISDRIKEIEEDIKALDEKLSSDSNYFEEIDPEDIRLRINKINDREMYNRNKLDDLDREYERKNKEFLSIDPKDEELSSEELMLKQRDLKTQLDLIRHQKEITLQRVMECQKARDIIRGKTKKPVKGSNKQADIKRKELLMSELTALKTLDDSKENKRVIRMIDRLQKKLALKKEQEELIAKEEANTPVVAPIIDEEEQVVEDNNPLEQFVEEDEVVENEKGYGYIPATFREGGRLSGVLSSLREKISKKAIIIGSIAVAAAITALVLWKIHHGQTDDVDQIVNSAFDNLQNQNGSTGGEDTLTSSNHDSFANGNYDYSYGDSGNYDDYSSSYDYDGGHSSGGESHSGGSHDGGGSNNSNPTPTDNNTDTPTNDTPDTPTDEEPTNDTPSGEDTPANDTPDTPTDEEPTEEPTTEPGESINLETEDPGTNNPEVGGDAPIDVESNAPTPIGEGYGDGTYWVDANGNIFTLGEDGIPSADDVYSGHLDWSKFDKVINEDGTTSFHVKEGVEGINTDDLDLKDVMDGHVNNSNDVVDTTNNSGTDSTVDDSSNNLDSGDDSSEEEVVEETVTEEEVEVDADEQPAESLDKNSSTDNVKAESVNDSSSSNTESSHTESSNSTESKPAESSNSVESKPAESSSSNDVEKSVDSVIEDMKNESESEEIDSVKSR